MATSADKGRSDIRPGQHPVSSTGRVEGGDETYGVYGTKGYYKSFQPQFKGRPLKQTEMDFNIDLIGQVIKGYRVVGNSLVQDEIDLVADIDKVLMFAEREMLDENGDPVYEDDEVTPKIEYIWELTGLGSISGIKGSTGAQGAQGASGISGAQGTIGAKGSTGLTGVKGEVGAQGLQGGVGAAAQAALVYAFTHDTFSPAAVPNFSGDATFYEQNGSLVISFTDNSLADNENKFLGLLATGSFDITTVSQTGGAGVYNQYSFSEVYVDFSTFSASSCVVVYASNINTVGVGNPDVNATGNITFNGNLPTNHPIFSNVFIDKWNAGGGAQGATGSNGTEGAQGAEGAQGTIGPSGGIEGAQGSAGTNGAQGSAGTNGAQGDAGTNGAQGAIGSGAQGVEGAQGDAGTNGAQGDAGTNGAQGDAGTNGAQGAIGSGAQGAEGAQGDAGTNGAQGDPGPSGGAQGASGTNGAQGDAGVLDWASIIDLLGPNPCDGEGSSTTYTIKFYCVEGAMHVGLFDNTGAFVNDIYP